MNVPDWRERAHRVVQDFIAPLATSIDRTHTVPRSIGKRLAEEGFFGLAIPTEYGGAAASAQDIAGVLEEIAFGSLSVATDLAVHLSVASAPIARWGTSEQKERWLPAMARGECLGAFALTEPGVGSDAQHLTTRYAREGDRVRLDGSKIFITNGGAARIVLVFATRDPDLEAKGISCFLVEHGTPGFSVTKRLEKLGLLGSETTELLFDGCRVEGSSMLGPEGRGFEIAMTALEGGRVGISATSLGVARAALALLSARVRMGSEDWRKSVLARAHVSVEAASALVDRAAKLKDAGEDYGLAASAAKLFCSQVAFDVARRAYDFTVELSTDPDERAAAECVFRDARVLTIVEGTTEIQELILGRKLSAPRAR